MKLKYSAIAFLGLTTLVGEVALPVQAQPLQLVAGVGRSSQSTTMDLIRQGTQEAKQGDTQGAITSYTQAL